MGEIRLMRGWPLLHPMAANSIQTQDMEERIGRYFIWLWSLMMGMAD